MDGIKEETRVFGSDVIVEEKIDGSQLVFMVSSTTGTLNIVTKKGSEIKEDDKDFGVAITEINKMKAHVKPGWVYIVEFLRAKQHNKVKYNEIPQRNLFLSDVTMKNNGYLSRWVREKEARRLGIEATPLIWEPTAHEPKLTKMIMKDLFNEPAYLGGLLIPGLVVKENVEERTWDKIYVPRGVDIDNWAANRS